LGTLVVTVGIGVVLLGPDQFTDLLFDLVHLRKAIQSVLGEDLSPVEKDFERSRLTRRNRHRPELVVVIVQ
jgi:Sec-independent protein translocase protein TatA